MYSAPHPHPTHTHTILPPSFPLFPCWIWKFRADVGFNWCSGQITDPGWHCACVRVRVQLREDFHLRWMRFGIQWISHWKPVMRWLLPWILTVASISQVRKKDLWRLISKEKSAIYQQSAPVVVGLHRGYPLFVYDLLECSLALIEQT